MINRSRRNFGLLSAGLCMASLLPGLVRANASASNFPERPLKIIVPWSPGSVSDSASRFFGEQLSVAYGQPVVVENKTGGGGVIAARAVKAAPADGYTILLGNISLMTVNPVVIKEPGYDPLHDFKPLSGLVVTYGALVVPNESPFKTVEDLVQAARQRPLNFGTFSPAFQLAAASLGQLSGAQFTNVAYKGNAPLVTDVLGNQLEVAFLDVSGSLALLQSRSMRVLAVTSRERVATLPDIPTLRELGYRNYAQENWVGFFTRAETPEAISNKLTDTLQASLHTAAAADFVNKVSVNLFPYPPTQLRDFIASEIARFQQLAKVAGMEPEPQ